MKILAISCEQDAGAAINIDGKIAAAVNEERFNRKKLYIGFPELSIKSVCQIANLSPSDFDYIAISTYNHISSLDYDNLAFHQKIGESLSKIRLVQLALQTNIFTNLVKILHRVYQTKFRLNIIKKLRNLGFQQKIQFIDHHVSHACSAYYTSGWNECLTVTLDGAGDGICSRVFITKGNKLVEVHHIPFYGSPGYYYSYATNICGFKYGREGKLTGLAAYGNPEITKDIFAKRIKYNPKKMWFINNGFYFHSEINYLKLALNGASKEDIAAGIQDYLEEMVLAYITDLMKRFNNNRSVKLALAGGVFANVKLNQKISELKNVSEIYVHPHMGDGGLAVGASFALLTRMNSPIAPKPLENAYLGTVYTNKDILDTLKRLEADFTETHNPAMTMAQAIAEGKVVAYYSGRMEYGPRALGNRSIFVSAKNPSVNNWLNKRLQRSEFMPFAPIVMKEMEDEYFLELDSKHNCNKFMTITCKVKEKALQDIPAAVHIDGTARFQSITRKQNIVVYDMLKHHFELTGVPAVINTSFNMHEEPIVESPEDAIRCFEKGHLDMLVIGDYVLEQKEVSVKPEEQAIKVTV